MEQKSDIAIVSVFGRGHWLAQDLVNEGFKVDLIDLTAKMGPWSPEDAEGPFGFFQSSQILPEQANFLSEMDLHESVPNGFTFLLPSGPLEMSGPMHEYHQSKLHLSSDVLPYLRGDAGDDQIRLWKKLKSEDFNRVWLAHFAHQLAATVYKPNYMAMEFGSPVQLTAPYSLRRVTRQGQEGAMARLRERGVRIFSGADVLDVVTEGRRLVGLEVRQDSSIALRSSFVVWTLSSEETLSLEERVSKTIFPRGHLRPTWFWSHYRIDMNQNKVSQSLPPQFAFISNLGLPWTHENLALLYRTVKSSQWDVWLRLPALHRFQRTYVEQALQKVLGLLSQRLPGVQFSNISMPQDFHYEYEEIGAPRFPVYDSVDKGLFRRSRFRNVYFDGPECWDNQDWTCRLNHEAKVGSEIKKALKKIKGEATLDQSI